MFFWFKSFHIIFIICWFAGLFYTPRIFVYIAESNCGNVQKQLLIMAKRLLYFITPFALLSIFFGIILLGTNAHYYIEKPWFICKLFCVFGLVCYHISCFYFLFSLQSDCTKYTGRYFRIYNELPVLLLFSIVILVTVKPNLHLL
jgi:protoporphyrinogen IX oxidase